MSATNCDPIIDAIGNIGKWQWLIITALASRDIFTSWQMLSQSFLGMYLWLQDFPLLMGNIFLAFGNLRYSIYSKVFCLYLDI